MIFALQCGFCAQRCIDRGHRGRARDRYCIAVNTAVFTAYKTFIVRQLDARAPDEMVNVALVRDSGAMDFAFSYPDYEAYRDAVQSLSGLVAFRLAQLTTGCAAGKINGTVSSAASRPAQA